MRLRLCVCLCLIVPCVCAQPKQYPSTRLYEWGGVAPGNPVSEDEANRVLCEQAGYKTGNFVVVAFPQEIYISPVPAGRHKYLIRNFQLWPEHKIQPEWLEEAHCFISFSMPHEYSFSPWPAHYLNNNGATATYTHKSPSGQEMRGCILDVDDFPQQPVIQVHNFTCYSPGIDQRSTIGDVNAALGEQGYVQVRDLKKKEKPEE